MTRETALRAKAVFADAIALPPGDRPAFLARRCGSDAALLDLVQELLTHHEPLGSFLRPPLEAVTMAAPELVRRSAGLPATGRAASQRAGGAPGCGDVVAERYRLETRLGAGAFGAVFRATDRLTGQPVAVKIMKRPAGASLGTWRREVATLRRTHLPGVVSLVDEGLLDDCAFIVMRLVSGTPFPGTDVDSTRLEDVCVGLLEALDRLHWAGLVHRDLKPDNVLVRADGRPVIVDLGIAWDGASDQADRTLVGTPAFIAPELFEGRAATVRSDLYSVGVMMFEVFAGRLPHPTDSFADLVAARTSRPAPRLASAAPGVHARVAETVDRLLRRDPERRPASAAETIARLRGDEPRRLSIPGLDLLGDDVAVRRLVAAARSGSSMHVFGPRGSGRTRALHEAARRLVDAGYEVRRTIPGDHDLWSLRTVVGAAPADGDRSARVAWARDRLRGLLTAGVVVIADDLERLDEASRELLRTERAAGAVLSTSSDAAFADAHALAPVPEEALRPLFAGPSRLLQIPEGAAHELWVRTAGYPGRVVAELDAWVRGGLARCEDERIVIERAAVERLRLDRTIHAPAPQAKAARGDDDRAAILEAVELCGVPARADVIGAALGVPAADVAGRLAPLESEGAVLRTPDGWILVVRAPRDPVRSTPALRAAAHDRIAGGLDVGDPRRLGHLVAAGRLDEVPEEASASAGRLLDAGHSHEALAVLGLAISVSRTAPDGGCSDLDGVMTSLLRAALLSFSRSSINTLLYHLGRVRERTPAVETVDRLARAASQGVHGNAERALAALRTPVGGDRPELEYWRHAIRLVTSQAVGDDALTEALRDLRSWCRAATFPAAASLLARWLGWRRYRRRRFAGAARLHRRAASLAVTPLIRVMSLTDAASASMEGCLYDEALESATACIETAREIRAPMSLARAERIARSARYRRGDRLAVDRELLAAAGALGVPLIEALICANEAAVAWRSGRRVLARTLAVRGSELAAGAGREPVALLQRALAVAAGEPLGPGEDEQLLARSDRCSVPGLAAQSAGLLALGGHPAARALGEIVRRNAERLPAALHGVRREIVSIAEALEFTSRVEGRR